MVNKTEARHTWYKIVALGFCIYLWPSMFERKGRQWYPKDEKGESYLGQVCNADLLRKRLFRSAISIAVIMGLALLVSLGISNPSFDGRDWLRLLAVGVALLSALGRGGWDIQTWKGDTAVERVDRAMYRAGQLGAVFILIFIMTME